MKITRISQFSGIQRTLELDCTLEQLRQWESGTFAQDAFPNLSADEREFIMTGVTKEEWDEAFKELEPPDYPYNEEKGSSNG